MKNPNQGLREQVLTARLAFVAAYGLREPTGVLVKICADAKKAEAARNFVGALRFYRQALAVYQTWQKPRPVTAKKNGLNREQRRAQKFDGKPVAKCLQPKLIAVTMSPTPVATPVVVVTQKTSYDVLKSNDELCERLEMLEIVTKGVEGLQQMTEAAGILYLCNDYIGAEQLRREIETRINAPALVAA